MLLFIVTIMGACVTSICSIPDDQRTSPSLQQVSPNLTTVPSLTPSPQSPSHPPSSFTTLKQSIQTLDAILTSKTNDNATCLSFKGQIAVEFSLVNNADDSVQHFLNVPSNAGVTGNCSLNETVQTLVFSNGGEWSLQFTFTEDIVGGSVHISHTKFTYDPKSFANKSVEFPPTFEDSQKDLLHSKLSGYFLCNTNTTLINQANFKVTVANLRYSVFNKDVNSADVEGSGCRGDLILSSTAPLATGVALVVMYAGVIVGYLLLSRHFDENGFKGSTGSKSYNLSS